MAGKSVLYERYDQDALAMENGRWLTHLVLPIKVRSARSKTGRTVKERLDKKYRQAELANDGVLPPDKLARKVSEWLAQGLVVAWGATAAIADGVNAETAGANEATDRDGRPLECTADNVYRVMMDLEEFRGAVFTAIVDGDTFRKAVTDELAGNSSAPSAPAMPSAATSAV